MFRTQATTTTTPTGPPKKEKVFPRLHKWKLPILKTGLLHLEVVPVAPSGKVLLFSVATHTESHSHTKSFLFTTRMTALGRHLAVAFDSSWSRLNDSRREKLATTNKR